MVRWQQQLLDGFTQALENKVVTDLLFTTLLLQVPNLQWQAKRQHGGSILGYRPNVAQEHELGHIQILCDYFIEHLIYNSRLFLC